MPDNITLVELAHRKDPNGNLATIAEVLAENSTKTFLFFVTVPVSAIR